MSIDLEKRIDRLEAVQDRVFGKLDELHVEFVTLSSKVGNGLVKSTQTHACEIEQLKTTHKILSDEVALRSKEFEVRHIRLSADLSLLENNIMKDFEQLKLAIPQEIRAEGNAFIDNLRKHREEERLERLTIEKERRSEIAKLAVERKIYIILGAIAVTLGAPLIIRAIDSLFSKL